MNSTKMSLWRAPIISLTTLALLLFSATAAHADTTSADEKSCKDFVQGFYDWYSKLARQEHKDSSDDIALKQKSANFSSPLTRALKEDLAASAKSKDGIVGLDFDPFLNAQDIGEKYTAEKVTKKGQNYLVDVYGVWNGKKTEKPDVTPELSHQNGQWVFQNFHYKSNGSKGDDNLLSVLDGLKKDRTKFSH